MVDWGGLVGVAMPRKRKVEPKYAVNISMKAWDLAKAGAAVTLRVRDRNGLLGTIEIGQGTFGWKGAKTKSGFKRISWRRLAEDFQRYH
jgi:hypothetical protein